MALATNKEHSYSPNDANLVIISFQILKNQSCHMMPKYFAEHSRRGMATISLRPVKVSSVYPIFTHSLYLRKGQFICIFWTFSINVSKKTPTTTTTEQYAVFIYCFCFFLPFIRLDNMIRIYDSTTVRYKCVNEIIARDMNWCILDIAFSPGSEYFIYSTWSSCCKCL